ncbi:MAG TPA: MarR family transcriptional regulator [Acidimicrobiia bacterium]
MGDDQPAGDELDAVGRALEALFRLNASRKVHALRAAAAGVPISAPGFVLLRRVQEDGPLPLGELARRTDMDPAAAGRQIRQLERDGLVDRVQGPGDGRVTTVSVTAAGAEARRRINGVLGRHMEEVLDAWSPADRADLARLLARLARDLRSVHYRTLADEPVASEVAGR